MPSFIGTQAPAYGIVAASFFSLVGKATIEDSSSLTILSPYIAFSGSRSVADVSVFAQAFRYSEAVSKGPPSPGRGPISQVSCSRRVSVPILGNVMDENSA